MFPLAFISSLPLEQKQDSISVAKNEIKLALDSHNVVESVSAKSTITPGESVEQKTIREKSEADAKAKAEADAKTKKVAVAQRNVVTRENRVYNDPSDFDQIYAQAGAAYGVDALILKAVHTVETGRSGSTTVSSSAGAQGPMQFLPSTWKRYAVDGNGDGTADIHNVSDAIYTAAKYLKACGFPDVKKALWGYNPSTSYYNKVMNVARSFGF